MLTKRLAMPLAAGAALLWIAAGTPALAETRIEQTLRLEPGGRFILDASSGGVEIRGTSRSGARIVVTSERDDLKGRYDFKFEEGPGTATVTSRRKGSAFSWFSWGSDRSPHFAIEVPEKTALQVATGGGHIIVLSIEGDSDLKTSGGHMEISELKGKLTANTSGGHITLRGIEGSTVIATSGGHISVTTLTGSLDARTSGGHVSLTDVTSDIETHTSGGHIEVQNAGGRIDAETSGGHVEVSFARGNSRGGHIASSGGGIHVKVDVGADLDVDAETGGGTVSTDLPLSGTTKVSKSRLKGSLGKGGEALVIRTSGGSIDISPN